MDFVSGSIDTSNLLSVCRAGDALDRALLREMLDCFIVENARRLTLARQAVDRGDREELRQIVHAIRGSAAMLGAGRLHDLAWHIELDAHRSDLSALSRSVDGVGGELDLVIANLQKAHPEAWTE